MGGDIDGQKRLTILSLCDFLQELLIDNDMQDLPVYVSLDGGLEELWAGDILIEDQTVVIG